MKYKKYDYNFYNQFIYVVIMEYLFSIIQTLHYKADSSKNNFSIYLCWKNKNS